ncbi:MAG TPA: hypothetical protein PKH69_10080 [Thiobacillaceae bacterium]|nr:hypothetical protein [Thiobacillaceae bacterium]HNU64824.1 hypothetical protein [Thiobacillaceae bacterium]
MAEPHLIPAASSLRSARLFNMLAVASTLLAVLLFSLGNFIADKKLHFLPMAMSLPPVAIWLAASIFVYAGIAHHPHPRVRHYNKWAGYRYYGLIGTVPIVPLFGEFIPGGWSSVAVLLILILVPWALYDVWRAGKEDWQDLKVEDVHKVGAQA